MHHAPEQCRQFLSDAAHHTPGCAQEPGQHEPHLSPASLDDKQHRGLSGAGAGASVGSGTGAIVGTGVGASVGTGVSAAVGSGVGAKVGTGIGARVGADLPVVMGATVGMSPSLIEHQVPEHCEQLSSDKAHQLSEGAQESAPHDPHLSSSFAHHQQQRALPDGGGVGPGVGSTGVGEGLEVGLGSGARVDACVGVGPCVGVGADWSGSGSGKSMLTRPLPLKSLCTL